MNQYRSLASAGATVILLHHMGKSESAQDYRGSSDIKAAVDVAYKLTDRGDGTRLSLLELRAFKQRICVTPHLFVRYENGAFTSNSPDAMKTVTERLTDLIKAHPGISKGDLESLAGQAGLGRNRARDFLKARVESGDVRVEDAGKRRPKKYYWGDHIWGAPRQ